MLDGTFDLRTQTDIGDWYDLVRVIVGIIEAPNFDSRGG